MKNILPLTEEQLHQLIPTAKRSKLRELTPHLNAAMDHFEINNIFRVAAFLAQITHESGSFVYVTELASGRAYDGRRDLGNTRPEAINIAKQHGTTPGPFYKGHGFIQITGYYNHKECGEALGVDAVNNPTELCTLANACMSAAWFWNTHNCNSMADAKLFDQTTRVINGGYNGRKVRQEFYDRNVYLLLKWFSDHT